MCQLQSLLRSSDIRMRKLYYTDDVDVDIGSSEISVAKEPSSACLLAMVNDFLEMDAPVSCIQGDAAIASRSKTFFSSCSGTNSRDAILKRAIQEIESIRESSAKDVEEAKIASCVAKALKSTSHKVRAEGIHNEQALSGVVRRLQRAGYDAGLCVTARQPGNAAGSPPVGGHRYIEVIMENKPVSGTAEGKRASEKVVVDVGFPAHFEIARPLPAYQKLIAILPWTFVGKVALLRKVVRIVSQAGRASLESQDMPIPPWRCFSFLLAKWLSPSSRITSFDEAKHNIADNKSSTNAIKPRVLAELNYNSDWVDLADPVPSDILHKGAGKGGNPSSANQIATNNTDNSSSSYSKTRMQVSVVSALALAFAEAQDTHVCLSARVGKVHNRLQQNSGC